MRCALGSDLRPEFKDAVIMNYFPLPSSRHGTTAPIDSGLFLWRGNGIVLMGQEEDGRFVLARGWIENDRLAHVRRWRFATPEQFAGQVRRLVMEASGDYQLAANERLASLNWLASCQSR
jgi:hypothetical protein